MQPVLHKRGFLKEDTVMHYKLFKMYIVMHLFS